MFKIAICEENIESLYSIKESIENIYSVSTGFKILYFSSGENIISHLDDTCGNIDVVLLAVRDNCGCETFNHIKESFPAIKLVVMQHLLDNTDITDNNDTVSVILTPITSEKLNNTLRRVIESSNNAERNYILLKSNREITRLRKNYIHYITSNKRTLIFHGNNIEKSVYAKLDDMQLTLGPGFVRCHKSYLVNLDHIKVIDKNGICLYSGEVIPISKKHYSETKQKFIKYTENYFRAISAITISSILPCLILSFSCIA